jgi:TIR domain
MIAPGANHHHRKEAGMLKITIGGKSVSPDKLGDALMRAAIEGVSAQMRERFSAVRRPDTGEFPTVVAHGDSLDTLSFTVEGSAELLALVRERFSADELEAMGVTTTAPTSLPRAFLSFAWEDRSVAEKIATTLQANGVDTWYAEWEIGAGDSLRQKIDAGLRGCTHFLVLLTPESITKPWVNQEMDAGLVRKLSQETRFIAVRLGMAAASLPPLLRGMLSPSIDDFDADMRQLVNDIHGISRKPPLGSAPAAKTTVASVVGSRSPHVIALLVIGRVEQSPQKDVLALRRGREPRRARSHPV